MYFDQTTSLRSRVPNLPSTVAFIFIASNVMSCQLPGQSRGLNTRNGTGGSTRSYGHYGLLLPSYPFSEFNILN